MKNKYFYPIFKLKAKSWIRYWLLKKTEFKGKLSEILTGFSFNLQNTLDRKFKLFEIQGNSVQDGEPSPDNEVPIKSAGDDINEFDKDNANVINGYIGTENKIVPYASNQLIYFSVTPLKTYTIKKYIGNSNIWIATSENEPQIASVVNNLVKPEKKEYTITMPENQNYLIIQVRLDADAAEGYTLKDILNGIKIVEGTYIGKYTPFGMGSITEKIVNVPEYVPHKEQTYSIYTQQPFRSNKDNTVRDCFVKKSDGWYERHKRGIRVFKGSPSEGWRNEVLSGNRNNFYVNIPEAKGGTENIIFNNIGKYANNLNEDYNSYISDAKNLNYRCDMFSNGSDFLNFLQTKNMIVEYDLEEPLDLPCTPEQIEILENLPKTYAGQTNIYSEDETPPYLRIQYWESDENG